MHEQRFNDFLFVSACLVIVLETWVSCRQYC